jgi:chromosome segregation protein
LRQQLQKIRERLERMGPINLAAINEHQELEERHRFLSTQEQDLSNSIASLKEIILRINRTTKDMFATTFAELQEKFGEVFAKFFRGGRAELQLVEVAPDETAEQKGPQEPGVEIVAQPPGKRLKNITMLSGGEKTRLALAGLIVSRANVLLLDEPTNNLDPASREEVLAAIRDYEGAIVLVTHDEGAVASGFRVRGTQRRPGTRWCAAARGCGGSRCVAAASRVRRCTCGRRPGVASAECHRDR